MKEISIDEETMMLSFSDEMLKKIEKLIDTSILTNYDREIYKNLFNGNEVYYRNLRELLRKVAASINKDIKYVVDNEELQNANLNMYNEVIVALNKYNEYSNEGKSVPLRIRSDKRAEKIEDIIEYINVLYEYKIKMLNLEVISDIARLSDDCKLNMSYFKSDEEIEEFITKYEQYIKEGNIDALKEMIFGLQAEILEEWHSYIENIDSMTDDSFGFIGHSTHISNVNKFTGKFYDNYVSCSLYDQDINDTYRDKIGFIMPPINIVGARSSDMGVNNNAKNDDEIITSSLIPIINHPQRILEETKKQKQNNIKVGDIKKVYSEIVIKGFNPIGLFCFTDGTLGLDPNYVAIQKLQNFFPNLKINFFDTFKNKKGIELVREKIRIIMNMEYDYKIRNNEKNCWREEIDFKKSISEEEIIPYTYFFDRFLELKQKGGYNEDDIRRIYDLNKYFISYNFNFNELFTKGYSDYEIKFIIENNPQLSLEKLTNGRINKICLSNIKSFLGVYIGKLNKYVDGLDEFVTVLNKIEITDELINELTEQKYNNMPQTTSAT